MFRSVGLVSFITSFLIVLLGLLREKEREIEKYTDILLE